MFNKLTLLLIVFISINSVYADNFGIGNSNSIGFGYGKDAISSSSSGSSSNLSGNCPGGYVVQNISNGNLQCVPSLGSGNTTLINNTYYYNITNNITIYQNTSEIDPVAMLAINGNYSVFLNNNTYNYNETAICKVYTDSIVTTYNTTWSSIFNNTYALYAYNQSSIYSYNHSLTLFNVYGIYWYNMTIPFSNWLSTFLFNYNQTIPAITYVNAQGFNSTFNQSLQNMLGQNCPVNYVINGTLANGTFICTPDQTGGGASGNRFNQELNTTSDVTFDDINFTGNFYANDSKIYYNGTSHLLNLTGVNLTLSGGSQLIGVTVPGDGSFNQTYQDYILNESTYLFVNSAIGTTANFTSGNWNTTIFNFSMLASTTYILECNLVGSSATTTTGLQLNLSVPNALTYITTTINNPTTATAPFITTCFGTARSCTDVQLTSVAAGVPIYITSRIENGASANRLELAMRSEINTNVVMQRGSWCKLTDV